MPRRREWRWPKTAAAYCVFLLLLAGITSFAYETAAPAYRTLVLRLAVAVLLGVVLLHVRSYFRGDPRWDPPSEFENALIPDRVAPKFDASLVKLRGELADGVRSRAYFDRVVWPRLKAIAERTGIVEFALPSKALFAWRGPSQGALARLISRLEERE